MWEGEYARAERDRFGGICIGHRDGSEAYVQPGDDANDLAMSLDACKDNQRMSREQNIDGLLCDFLEG